VNHKFNTDNRKRKSTLSSASNGRWRRISKGSVSAAITMNSAIPLFNVLVAATTPAITQKNTHKYLKLFQKSTHQKKRRKKIQQRIKKL